MARLGAAAPGSNQVEGAGSVGGVVNSAATGCATPQAAQNFARSVSVSSQLTHFFMTFAFHRRCGRCTFIYFGGDRRCGLTGTVFGPGLGEGFAGSDGGERLCGLTGTVFLVKGTPLLTLTASPMFTSRRRFWFRSPSPISARAHPAVYEGGRCEGGRCHAFPYVLP